MAKYVVQIGKTLATDTGRLTPIVWKNKKTAEGFAKQRSDAFVLKLRRNQRPKPIDLWWLD